MVAAMSANIEQAGFFDAEKDAPEGSVLRPLAVRMRPQNLSEIIGQDHIVGDGCLLPRLIQADNFGSLIFYGPPGCGKTSMAEVIAAETQSKFVRINAVLSNVAEMRDILRMARYEPDKRTILFIDEIHRFNKSQQDLLLPDVEAGNIRLIGATTHNPGFYVNPPLLSRSHLFRLEPVDVESVATVLERALLDAERGLGTHRCTADAAVYQAVADFSGGDLRRALNAMETLVLSQPLGSHIDADAVEVFARERQIRYDRDEDEHYDHASAMIKSIRGSDPDAALYWTFKMLQGGEDPRYIARRLTILASEDVGLANSHALTVAVAAFEAAEKVGMPECEYNLAHAVLYLATSPKSNSVTRAMHAVKKSLRDSPIQAVPLWLRDAHTKTNKALGHGDGYRYSHDYPSGVSGQEFMLQPQQFYVPGHSGAEAATAQRLEQLKKLKAEIQRRDGTEQD
ncbi:ATPase, AAA family protein [Lentimonas sp. CC19]|nr:ATPase, AAA family protein [Lentimonas sp. CC4]CAA6686710.1 ATPase, AAA family protein [Lentimonas sp. CC6]CAA6692932.1 ATPase, AAA family protein [Lentimonas sp. CC10]CAA6695601.1 ATPase, AAA family protein [Lentimonas sp. CC19]CAA7069929.1 ATPase, AAA family protein [Lentimonas sp. CC11]CAA7168128.1 ATPase, AAA family protein [Lentimonas sp. CC21]CAA7181723.1 ATPase, AAA family protein [Lentimonas sp. CC8]